MGGIKVSIHPLFFCFGFYYALTSRIFIFIIYTITAILHEVGQSFAASKQGYKLNKITLMPFGAVVSGNIDGLQPLDEIKIALAGPLINLSTGLLFVALWWIYPQSYAFTDVVAFANFAMAIVNLIPAYPLDGGRIAFATLNFFFKKEKAKLISKILSILLSLVLLTLFIISLFFTPNLTILFFALFILFGAFSTDKENKYVKLTANTFTSSALLRGVVIKRKAIDKGATIKRLIAILDETAINEIVVFSQGKPLTTLSQEKLEEVLKNCSLYDKIEKYL